MKNDNDDLTKITLTLTPDQLDTIMRALTIASSAWRERIERAPFANTSWTDRWARRAEEAADLKDELQERYYRADGSRADPDEVTQ